MRFSAFIALLLVLILNAPARAGRFEPPFPLDKLDASANLIVKATVLATQPATPSVLFNNRFSGPVDATTNLRVISVLKGDLAPGSEFVFTHKSSPQNEMMIVSGGGAIYDFVPARSYLIWVVRDGEKWKAVRIYNFLFDTQGALLAPDDAPVAGTTRDVVWQQTTALLKSKDAAKVKTGIANLSYMARRERGDDFSSGDFKREAIVDAVAPLIDSADASIANAAVRALGLLPARAMPRLLEMARAKTDPRRQTALAALGKVQTPEVAQLMRDALADADPTMRALAVSLLRYRKSESVAVALRHAARDADPKVRRAVAVAVSQLNDPALKPILSALARDTDEKVAQTARAMLSFD